MRNLDFSSWHAMLSTVLGLALITLIMVGVRLLAMHTVQQRRERENRQINERLRTLIAAYKTLGGSFTGNLAVDPTHRRDLRQREDGVSASADARQSSDRSRRVRDAVEAALSDIILLGTEEQVLLAARAATELAEGRPTHTADLVVSLRDFIRKVLDLEPVPTHLAIPRQGPSRTPASRGKGDDAKGGGKSGGGGLGGGMGGMGGSHASLDEEHDTHH
ncbi:MAG TPA: hypothetical protein VFG49_15715 [Dyella sp.]|uniref:hypothetical protein n=1 Tax=Dyella sp. TaxID=1869338 RepID=UPI002D78FAFB|nr:hypothetical protein [Dyella sp.]HET6554974.1 hypothetical protein [Dyella sp.]